MSPRRSATTALALFLLAAPLAAQGVNPAVNSPDQTAAVVAAPVAPVAAPVVEATASQAPTVSNVAVGVRANVATPAPAPVPFQGNAGRNPAMMIVGGVALLVGAVVGGDSGLIIMVAGGALGLYGLWQYLK